MRFVANLFKEEFHLAEHEWWWLPNVKRMINRLFSEACQGVHGKWQWRYFSMENWELEKYSHIVLRTYVAGGEIWFD